VKPQKSNFDKSNFESTNHEKSNHERSKHKTSTVEKSKHAKSNYPKHPESNPLHFYFESNIIYEFADKKNLLRYLQTAYFSPVPPTRIKAINNGHFATWPGLT
jgi:spore cortex formation protein SpoVR/YcgB (stage V sporulation)